jgi:hypothetical protein
MADRIKSHTVERVKLIREWESKNNFKEAKDLKGFTLYKNYFVPESIAKTSKTLLSFGVGGNVGFEKELAWDNKDIQAELYDPTPRSVSLIKSIIRGSSRKKIIEDSNPASGDQNVSVAERLHFNPVAYAKVNGTLPFYYDPAREPDKKKVNGKTRSKEEIIRNQEQSFSLVKRQEHFESVDVEAKNLETIMRELDLTRVDMLKADIEGLWWEFGHELLDKKIDCKFIAMEFELNFEKDEKIEPALDKAQLLCDKFKANNYDVIINRRRDKLMLEMLFIRKDVYEG